MVGNGKTELGTKYDWNKRKVAILSNFGTEDHVETAKKLFAIEYNILDNMLEINTIYVLFVDGKIVISVILLYSRQFFLPNPAG